MNHVEVKEDWRHGAFRLLCAIGAAMFGLKVIGERFLAK